MMKAIVLRILILHVVLCVLIGCKRRATVEDVDLSPARLPANSRIEVDGSGEEDVWEKAAILPFGETGQARFLWDNHHLYGFVGGYESATSGFRGDEQICIGIRTKGRAVSLYFEEKCCPQELPFVLVLREAWLREGLAESYTREPLPNNAIQVASDGQGHAQGDSWWVEFSLDWGSISDTPLGEEKPIIGIYRLVPTRATHLLMFVEHDAQEGDGP